MGESISVDEIENKIQERKSQQVQLFKDNQKELTPKITDEKEALVENMFKDAVVHQVANNQDLNSKVLSTAKKYTETKMQTIETNVDTEHKEAVYNNNKDACESYGFNEKTTPTWAIKVMKIGYSVMLAIYLFVASFTVMPVIFLGKKIQVAVKKTWIGILLAFIIYACVIFVPIIVAKCRG